jgi:HEAT repeats
VQPIPDARFTTLPLAQRIAAPGICWSSKPWRTRGLGRTDRRMEKRRDGPPGPSVRFGIRVQSSRSSGACVASISALRPSTSNSNGQPLPSALGYVADAGSPAADELVHALGRPDGGGNVFFAAVEALAEMGDRRAIEPCLRRLDSIDFGALSDNDQRDAEYAIEALGTLQASEAVGPLISALEIENLSVRELAAYALGDIGDPRAVPALASLLKSAPGYVIENACSVALGAIGTDEAWMEMTLPPPDEPEPS